MTALICLTYDDALAVHREVVAPDLTAHGMKGTFYVPASRDELHLGLDGWRKLASMGHELGNHSCWHPCHTRKEWEWKPQYRLEDYDVGRIRDELLLANRILYLIDGLTERSYGATCSDLTCGPGGGVSFIDEIQDLFKVVRSGHSTLPMQGPATYVIPALPGDFYRADEIISVAEKMYRMSEAWMLVVIHGVGYGTHNSFMDATEHQHLLNWIASQSEWLEAVTVLEAVKRRGYELVVRE